MQRPNVYMYIYIHAFVCQDDVEKLHGFCYERVLTNACVLMVGVWRIISLALISGFTMSLMLVSLVPNTHQESASAMCSSVFRRPCAAISA